MLRLRLGSVIRFDEADDYYGCLPRLIIFNNQLYINILVAFKYKGVGPILVHSKDVLL